MSFLFRRNNSKNSTTSNNNSSSKLDSSSSSSSAFVRDLKQIKTHFQEQRRAEIVGNFVERLTVLFAKIIRTESEKGNYSVERKGLTITNNNCDLLTSGDRLKISDEIKKTFSGYFVSIAVKTNSVDMLVKWESVNEMTDEDNFWNDNSKICATASESKAIADNYNKLPRLVDDLPDSNPVEPAEEIVEHILDYLRSSTERYGSVPRQYTYRFPHTASTNDENSNYRKTMNEVIKLLPSDFQSVKGTFQRTSKNAIVSFMLEFVIDV